MTEALIINEENFRRHDLILFIRRNEGVEIILHNVHSQEHLFIDDIFLLLRLEQLVEDASQGIYFIDVAVLRHLFVLRQLALVVSLT